jgi:hypothetical protein
MNAAISQNENRRSCRMPAGEPGRGELELADQLRWPVSIVDQSAGGLGPLTDGMPIIACGDIVQFLTDSFVCDARVVHVTKIERSDANAASPTERQCRLGLA